MPSLQTIHKVIKLSTQLYIRGILKLNAYLILFYRAAIGSFGRAGRSAKGLRPSAANKN
jgi:hypothetical protein